MLTIDCWAYTNVSAEIRQQTDTFVVALKTQNAEISLSLNYMQVRELAEGLQAVLKQALIQDLLKTGSSCIMGDMEVRLEIAYDDEIDNQEGDEELCQQSISSAQTDDPSLSKTA